MLHVMKDQSVPFSGLPRESLSRIRDALVDLHKVLLQSEREQYETVFGPIASTQHFLWLALNHGWFSWLRPLSSLAAEMDDALDEKDFPVSSSMVAQYLESTRKLLKFDAAEESGFGQQYLEALQRDPDVILSHATLTRVMQGKAGL